MRRIAFTLGTISLSAFLFSQVATAQGAGGELEVLKSRIAVLESRVLALENAAASTVTQVKPPRDTTTRVSYEEPASPAQKEVYVIVEGDTISKIADRYSVPRKALMEANGIREGQQIFIGDRLVIPSKPKARPKRPENSFAGAAPKPAPAGNTGSSSFYTVKYGDTLSAISRKTGASVAAIKAANGMKSDAIAGGQRLKIPGAGGGGAPSNSAPAFAGGTSAQPVSTNRSSGGRGQVYDNPLLQNDETYGEYTVQKGDNLYALARDFFTTMKELQRLNKLGNSTLIYPGNKLIVPTGKYNEYHNKVASR
ncbi:MAG: LysM peptidoglycan-binding domain-containing protein [Verrucomicrobiales bacterium]|nr:LysM peptidoglycan-binding domain-containing protein [Verrucomicrobiales bacterium]